ncbi:MAG: MBL fold metallo-hydrolase [Dehalococcoidales bacterium]|nr:MBL fold metallo-hydrolase [Dehalococcoidales bacterium]
MKVRWLGHACFLITSEENTRIITDPYLPRDSQINYSSIEEKADIVVVSHNHEGHNNIATVKGNPSVVKGVGLRKFMGIEFKGLASFHDTSQGRQMGINTIFSFSVNGVRICHLGDLGQLPSALQIYKIGKMDVLLLPTGGGTTIGPAEATELCEKLKPKVVIPMHFKTDKCTYLPAGVNDFTMGKTKVKFADTCEVEFRKDSLPVPIQIMVLKHAM